MGAPADNETFRALKTDLMRWYTTGAREAADRFIKGWLQRRAVLAATAVSTGADAQDFAQELMMRFLDRDRAPGADAQSFRFWTNKLRWLAKDQLRAVSRRQNHEIPDEASASPQDAVSSDETLDRLDATLAGSARVAQKINAVALVRRVYFLALNYRVLGPLFGAEEVAYVHEQCGLPADAIRTRLHQANGDVDAVLPLLFGPRAETEPKRCREALARGRRRTVNDLLIALAEEAAE